jgi:hypothetical protein
MKNPLDFPAGFSFAQQAAPQYGLMTSFAVIIEPDALRSVYAESGDYR